MENTESNVNTNNIQEQLLVEISRNNTNYIAKIIGNDASLFDKLVNLVFKGSSPIPLRAAWVVSTVTDVYPELLTPYVEKIINTLEMFDHTGICRNLLRQLAECKIPDDLQGKLYDICYTWLLSRHQPPAVKVHCMQILFNIAQLEPDLKPELKLILEELTGHDSAAIKSRSRQLMMKM